VGIELSQKSKAVIVGFIYLLFGAFKFTRQGEYTVVLWPPEEKNRL